MVVGNSGAIQAAVQTCQPLSRSSLTGIYVYLTQKEASLMARARTTTGGILVINEMGAISMTRSDSCATGGESGVSTKSSDGVYSETALL